MTSHLRTKPTLSYIKLYLHVMLGFLRKLHFVVDPPSRFPLHLFFCALYRQQSQKPTTIPIGDKNQPVKIVYQNDTQISCVQGLLWNEWKKKYNLQPTCWLLPPPHPMYLTILFLFMPRIYLFMHIELVR